MTSLKAPTQHCYCTRGQAAEVSCRHSVSANFLRFVHQNEINSYFSIAKYVYNQYFTQLARCKWQISDKQARKKLCLCLGCWRIGIKWNIAALKHKRNRKFGYFSVRSIFISSDEHQKQYFHEWLTTKWYFHSRLRHPWKYRFWCSFGEIKIDLTLKNSNILYFLFKSESKSVRGEEANSII